VAYAAGVTTSPVMNELLTRGREFSFVQVMRLARMFLDPRGKEGLPEVPWQDRVRIRPPLSLAFPASDVARVERDGSDLRITATFLALYGPASPLPNFYTEDLFEEASSDESVVRDFVDIIHQRLYHLYFQCWNKYRLFIRVVEEKNPIDRERLFCLIGLGEKELARSVPDSYAMLRYTGLLTQYPRSALGLRTMLRDGLKIKRIRIIRNVKRMVPIPPDQRMRMGVSGCRLGMDTVLGSEIADLMGKFRIEIGPLGWDEYNSFLPGTPLHEKLARYVRFYLTDPLAFDLKLILAAGEAKPLRLGDPKARLGLNTWCFSGNTLGEMSVVFPVSASPAKKLSPSAEPDFTCPSPIETGQALVDYYREERARLGELAVQFAEAHPNLASMVSGSMADPGVERLLEGTAFFNAMLQRKLDDDIPEFIHEVIHALQPEYLRPIPASTIVAFTPKQNCTEPQIIPVGTQLDSMPVEGTSCRFTTSFPVEIYPLTLTDASFAHPSGKAAAITLGLELKHIRLQDWRPKSLRIFLAGEYERAADLHLLFTRHLNQIVISSGEERNQAILEPSYLKPVGFGDEDVLFPSHSSDTSSDRFVRDYSILPEKFLFLELQGWERWRSRGEGTRFTISFEFDRLPFPVRKITKDDFVLFATPAVNVFPHRAEPIILEDFETHYTIIPAGGNPEHYEVYSIEKVAGIIKGTAKEAPFTSTRLSDSKSGTSHSYQMTRSAAFLRQGLNTFLSVKIPSKTHPDEIARLSVELLCTNGRLPEIVRLGDICKQTGNSPSFATFADCKPVTGAMFDAFEDNRLWRLLSLCCINPRLLTAESLRAILKLICASVTHNWSMTMRNEKRISGIVGIKIEPCGRIIKGAWRQGWNIWIYLDRNCFCSQGDLYLFGTVLDRFLGGFASELYFTRTFIEDVQSGVEYEWSAKIGRKHVV
jgi:type VI secretion system protein ImpG